MLFLRCLSFIILLLTSSIHAQMTQVMSLADAMKAFKNADCNTLAVFDLDMVLIQPSDPAFQMPMVCRYGAIAKRVMKSVPANKQDIFLTLMAIGSDPVLIDTNAPGYLNQLYQMGVPTIALTANLTGQLMSTELVPWKLAHLRALGLDFTYTSPLQGEHVFSNLPAYRGNYPTYQNGVLFTNSVSKGESLVSFLKYTNLHVERVIFIDDRDKNLQDVEQSLASYNPKIAYEGIHYIGACSYPCQTEITEQAFEKKWTDLAAQAETMD